MYIVLAVAAVGALVALYFAFAPGPRRWRAFHRARKQLEAGNWAEALKLAQARGPSRLPSASPGSSPNLVTLISLLNELAKSTNCIAGRACSPSLLLTRIAVEQLGSAGGVNAIIDLNQDVLKGKDVIRPNMKLRLPAKPMASAQ